MNHINKLLAFISICSLLGARESAKGLKDYYRDYFPIGVAVSTAILTGEERNLILSEFNSITPENAMKPGPIHPEENRYFWRDADSIVNFAVKNHIKVRGHTLCWHQQTGDWFFKGKDGAPASKEVLLARLKEHITTVVSRYRGKVYAWDVVNEAIADDSKEFLRDTQWYKICGEDFIASAFRFAHEADPDALLFYNDYNSERPEKRERIYKLLKNLVDAKVPVNGVGMQGHWSIYEPSENDLRQAIEKFSALGLQVQITELDVSIYPWEKFERKRKEEEIDAFTPELEKKQIDQYKMAFNVFRDYKETLTGVTFWNLSDRHTWLDEYPVKGRKNYPLLFDVHLKPKKVYQDIVNW